VGDEYAWWKRKWPRFGECYTAKVQAQTRFVKLNQKTLKQKKKKDSDDSSNEDYMANSDPDDEL
ncbi:hypothetical protein BpHYR1_035404, partial [Brachionus plicatilis]